VKWATRRDCHIDRTSSAWLIRRFVDPEATFVFVDDPDQVPADATPFDIAGVAMSHHDGGCTFETFLTTYGLTHPVLVAIGRIVHEADIGDDRYDAPEAPGLDAVVRGMSMSADDDHVLLERTGPLFDGLYAYLAETVRPGAPAG
jgi:hypothetical protein